MEGSEPPMKSLLLQNIGDITAEEIVDLFSLTSPSRVTVSASDGENNVNIEVPESCEVFPFSGNHSQLFDWLRWSFDKKGSILPTLLTDCYFEYCEYRNAFCKG